MLIVAQPKSASTSLLVALGEATGLEARQEFGLARQHERSSEFTAMRNTDMVEASPGLIRRWTAPDLWRKQHVPPTENNFRLLRSATLLLTLRSPMGTLDALRRLPGYDCKNSEELQLRVLQELKIFNSRWRRQAEAWGDLVLVYEFEQIVERPSEVVNRALEHFGRAERVSEDFELPRCRYTGGGAVPFKHRY